MSFTRHFGRNILNGRLKHFERGLKINTAAIQRTKETEEQGRQVLVNPTQLKYLKLDVSSCFWEDHAFKSILGKTEDKTHCAVFTKDKMSLLPVVSLPNVGFWIYLLYRCQKKGKKFLE